MVTFLRIIAVTFSCVINRHKRLEDNNVFLVYTIVMKYLGSKGKYFAVRLIQAREDIKMSRTELANALTEAGFLKDI